MIAGVNASIHWSWPAVFAVAATVVCGYLVVVKKDRVIGLALGLLSLALALFFIGVR